MTDQTASPLPPLRSRVTAPERVDLPDARGDVTWRPMVREDAVAVHALRRASGRIDHPAYIVTLEEIERDLERSEIDLVRDAALAQDAQGEIVAYGSVVLLSSQSTLVRSVLDGAVHPARRREGIGEQLLAWQEQRALQQLATSEKTLPGWILSFADERAEGALALFSKRGFEFKRWWLELSRDLAEPLPVVPLDDAVRVVPVTDEWSERIREARNDVFRDHWGSQPIPADTWADLMGLPIARPDLSWLAVDRATDEIVAFVLTTVNEEEWEQVGFSHGYVEYVGVRRTFRGRGIAQALLVHALGVYRERGLDRAVLDVDSESPTGAVGLYEHLGFRAVNRSVSLVREF
ncbi:Mycothiol acetyltransferase [Frondihabitans sp. 762G35]|uniref:GNAT family N-acetyltransferase n=1 Tax=Frondihabitans sp. 762G35 TaxID=1446794 RepID=UPI000D210E16|nr:GNAT family N-acetyltransferase [Frondihabitans sp. 762G35]ARC55727.1 Mycothiol acetyltransferase [Frondihabitans sp. 762G35]